jgi:hypothetical protein
LPLLIFLAIVVTGALGILGLSRVLGRYRRGKEIEPIVRIGYHSGLQEADLARRTLSADGIWSRAAGGVVNTHQALRVTECEIWVREEDAEQARAILRID